MVPLEQMRFAFYANPQKFPAVTRFDRSPFDLKGADHITELLER